MFKLLGHNDGILSGMLIIIFPTAHTAKAPAAVKGNGVIVGRPHLQRQKRQVVALGKVQKDLQELSRDALPASVLPDRHIGDVPLVQHRL